MIGGYVMCGGGKIMGGRTDLRARKYRSYSILSMGPFNGPRVLNSIQFGKGSCDMSNSTVTRSKGGKVDIA